MKRWVVRANDGATVADILRAAREPETAVAEGRVFLGKHRVNDGATAVRPGDEVRIGQPTPGRGAGAASPIPILLSADELVACLKPAGIPTVPDHAASSHSLVHRVAAQLRVPVAQLRITSRLDRDVSGVVVFARSEAAEARLKDARSSGRYVRRYVAIAANADALLSARRGAWTASIGRAADPRLRAAVEPGDPSGREAKSARTAYAVVAEASSFALLAVAPETGRTHQIRLHASHAGAPLLGDRDYGGPSRVTTGDGRIVAVDRIALHAARVEVPGAAGRRHSIEAPIPPELTRAWSALGGALEAWDTAVRCSVS